MDFENDKAPGPEGLAPEPMEASKELPEIEKRPCYPAIALPRDTEPQRGADTTYSTFKRGSNSRLFTSACIAMGPCVLQQAVFVSLGGINSWTWALDPEYYFQVCAIWKNVQKSCLLCLDVSSYENLLLLKVSSVYFQMSCSITSQINSMWNMGTPKIGGN